MLNFTVGPVQSNDTVRKIGSEQVPYFRTQEFSDLMLENEKIMKLLIDAEESSRVVFITGSGTASMEASIMNTLTDQDKVLVVNGGSFGQRFANLCEIHEITFDEIKLDYGKSLTSEILSNYDNKGYTALLINVHETSTGVLYNMNLVSDFCKRNNIFLITDCISSFLADKFSMKEIGADVVITGSQKALACPPGVSIIVLSEKAIKRIENNKVKSLYFDLKKALNDGERGQTPFTPAVGILIQINARLKEIEHNGGVDSEIAKVIKIAEDFRKNIADAGFPFELFSENMSNAVTALHPTTTSANTIFTILKDEYEIWICPNGGDLKDKVFRVGHIGNLSIEDNKKLISALKSMQERKLI